MRLASHAVVEVLLVVLMVAGVSANDMPHYTNTSTVTCSGTTTFFPEEPVVTSTVISYITVTLEPSEVYHPTWKNPLPFCDTVTLAPSPAPTSATKTQKSVTTSTVIATSKQAVTVIITPSPPNFSPTPKPPIPNEEPPDEPPPTESPTDEPSSTFKPAVVTLDGSPITLPSVVSKTTVVISGITITVGPTEAIASGTTIEIPAQPTGNPPPPFTGGAAGSRRGAGAWAALAVGLLVV